VPGVRVHDQNRPGVSPQVQPTLVVHDVPGVVNRDVEGLLRELLDVGVDRQDEVVPGDGRVLAE
jgi:hypothetical protein